METMKYNYHWNKHDYDDDDYNNNNNNDNDHDNNNNNYWQYTTIYTATCENCVGDEEDTDNDHHHQATTGLVMNLLFLPLRLFCLIHTSQQISFVN